MVNIMVLSLSSFKIGLVVEICVYVVFFKISIIELFLHLALYLSDMT